MSELNGKTKEELLSQISELKSENVILKKQLGIDSEYVEPVSGSDLDLSLFKKIAENANYGVVISDVNGNVLYLNETFALLHAMKREDLHSVNLRIFYTDKEQENIEQKLEKLIKKGSLESVEVWHRRSDGTEFPTFMNMSVLYDNNHAPQYFYSTTIDISEIKLAEKRLKESAINLNISQEIAKMGSWEYDIKLNSLTGSRNYYRMHNLDPNKKLDNLMDYFLALVHPEDLHLVNYLINECFDRPKTEVINIRMLMPDSTIKWYQNNIVPVFENDKLVGLKGVNIDITEKIFSDQLIVEKNKRQEAIIQVMPDFIYILDKNGVYKEIHFPEKYRGILDENSLLGKNVFDVHNPSEAEFLYSKINECLDKQDLLTLEFSLSYNDRKLNYFEARVVPISSDQVLAVVQLVTEKKEREFELIKLSEAVKQSPVGILISDVDGVIEFVNPAFERITGYQTSAVLGKHTRMLKSGKNSPEVYADLWKTITSGNHWTYEWLNRRASGELYWENIFIAPIFNDKNQIINYLALKKDISKRKASEQEILYLNNNLEVKVQERTRELDEINQVLFQEINEKVRIQHELEKSEYQYRSVVENVHEVIFQVDENGKWIFLNQAWELITGFTVLESLNRMFTDFFFEEDKAWLMQLYLEMGAGIRLFINGEVKLKKKNGDYCWVEFFVRKVSSDKLDKPVFFGSLGDITENKKVGEKLLKAQQEAEKANVAKSEFLSRMSHELRTPLNSILGFSQLLEMGNLDSIQRKSVTHINRSGKHLLELINEVLDISRIESGRLQISIEPIRLKPLLVEMIEVIKPMAGKRNIDCYIEDFEDIFVSSDIRRMKQVLLNLLNNAVKYNRENGFIKVVVSTSNPDFIRISIIDSGTGIEPTLIDRIFSPFERAVGVESDIEGTGLGLAVVKRIMDALGGRVGVDSKPDQGSTFWVEFRLVQNPNEIIQLQLHEIPLKNDPNSSQRATIMYVEDNESNSELIEQIMSIHRPGFKLVNVPDGRNAVKRAEEYQPDILFLDLNLNVIDGMDVLSELKSNANTKKIPVVILSADAMYPNVDALYALGIEKFMTKPIDVNDFLLTLNKYISK